MPKDSRIVISHDRLTEARDKKAGAARKKFMKEFDEAAIALCQIAEVVDMSRIPFNFSNLLPGATMESVRELSDLVRLSVSQSIRASAMEYRKELEKHGNGVAAVLKKDPNANGAQYLISKLAKINLDPIERRLPSGKNVSEFQRNEIRRDLHADEVELLSGPNRHPIMYTRFREAAFSYAAAAIKHLDQLHHVPDFMEDGPNAVRAGVAAIHPLPPLAPKPLIS